MYHILLNNFPFVKTYVEIINNHNKGVAVDNKNISIKGLSHPFLVDSTVICIVSLILLQAVNEVNIENMQSNELKIISVCLKYHLQ